MNELMINLVMSQRRNALIRLAKKGNTASRHCSAFSVFPIIEQSGESEYLRRLLKVNCMKHGKPDKPHSRKLEVNGILTAREREGLAGMGCWRKRMPGSNSPDRGCYE